MDSERLTHACLRAFALAAPYTHACLRAFALAAPSTQNALLQDDHPATLSFCSDLCSDVGEAIVPTVTIPPLAVTHFFLHGSCFFHTHNTPICLSPLCLYTTPPLKHQLQENNDFVILFTVLSSATGSRRSPGEGNGNPLQYSSLENPHGLVGYSPRGHPELDTTE